MPIPKEAVEEALARAFLGGGALRKEDRQKALELAPLLEEMARALPQSASRRTPQAPTEGGARRRAGRAPFLLVDACAGKSAAGLLFLALVAPGGDARVLALEGDPARLAQALEGARALGVLDRLERRTGDVGDPALWPEEPDLVVALHACGEASDRVIERALAARAKRLLLVPCCYGAASTRTHDGRATRVPAQEHADRWAAAVGIPRHALVQRRFAQALIDAERTARLEAAGYETEVVEFVAPTVSPHCLLWRARRVGEPVRSAEGARAHAMMRRG